MRLNFLLVCLLMGAVSNSAVGGSIKKWVDANGQVHYGDKPPNSAVTTDVKVRKSPVVEQSQTKKSNTQSSNTESRSARMERQKKSRKRSAQTNSYDALLKNAKNSSAEKWKKNFVKKCKENRGTNCEDPAYQEGHRPLTQQEQRDVVHARRWRERQVQENRARQGYY